MSWPPDSVPSALVAKLSSMADSEAMPMSDAVEKSGMLQVIASLPRRHPA